MFKFSYGSSRGKKIWVRAYKELGAFLDKDGNELKKMYRLASIELNPIENKHKVVWIIEEREQEVIVNLSKKQEQELIQSAYNFAKRSGYVDKVISRYSK